jgi:hypothetical protein
MDPVTPNRSALVIAHPGHELRVHHWLERTRPVVLVLTDGSGHHGISRLDSTRELLARAGAAPGPLFGRLSDGGLYRALLDGDFQLFHNLMDELAAALDGVGLVAGDAVEGYNPGHDVCRLLLNAALLRLEAETGRPTPNFDFPLVGAPDAQAPDGLRLELDDEALRRKLEAAHAYPELAGEVEAALAAHGEAPFRVECLRPVTYGLAIGHLFSQPPFYETHGEKRVAEGHYCEVIRFREHLAPLAESLARHAMAEGRATAASLR